MDKTDELDGKFVEDYRMNSVKEVENTLKSDILNYTKLLKKYKKLFKILEVITQICNFINLLSTTGAAGSSGIGLLPVVLPCATIAGIATLISTTLHVVNKKINGKRKKHTEIIMLAQRTKNQLQKLISRIADDDNIDKRDFELIMKLQRSYCDMKQTIAKKK